MQNEQNQSSKGILGYQASTPKFILRRYPPSDVLSALVKHYWIIHWDLTDQPPFSQTVLSHPNLNMVIEDGEANVFGVSRTTSSHMLEGRGAVLGVKFMPGGFYPFWGESALLLLENAKPASDIFGEEMKVLASSISNRLLSGENGEMLAAEVDQFFQRKLPKRDLLGEYVNEVVSLIAANPSIIRVQELANKTGSHARTLQRLFNRYIGVSPKWVIQRYRLHEAAEEMKNNDSIDWAHLALQLGYYDQAHFIKDFKAIVGKSPEGYKRTLIR